MLDETSQPVDLSYLQEYTDGNEEALKELIEVFTETFMEELGQLKGAIKDGESKEWSEVAHKLKGASAFVGAEHLRKLCAEAQKMVSASAADRSALYEKISLGYENVSAYLKEIDL
ncbi:MAG: Hpt domain-containing protein [Alphaproteobacteria bacterium]|nr:Hpt domain-containing protein [Alphaproteobacteria bacterium]